MATRDPTGTMTYYGKFLELFTELRQGLRETAHYHQGAQQMALYSPGLGGSRENVGSATGRHQLSGDCCPVDLWPSIKGHSQLEGTLQGKSRHMSPLSPILLSSNVLLATHQPDLAKRLRARKLAGQLGKLEGLGAGPEQQPAKNDLKRKQQMSACRDQKQALFLVPKVSTDGRARPHTHVLTNVFRLTSHL